MNKAERNTLVIDTSNPGSSLSDLNYYWNRIRM